MVGSRGLPETKPSVLLSRPPGATRGRLRVIETHSAQPWQKKYFFATYKPGARFLLNSRWLADGPVTLSAHPTDPLPRADLLKAHAIFARIWDSLGMEDESQILLAIKSQLQLEPDSSTEIPAHCTIF